LLEAVKLSEQRIITVNYHSFLLTNEIKLILENEIFKKCRDPLFPEASTVPY